MSTARAWPLDRVLELIAALVIFTGLIGLAAALAGIFHAPQVLLASLLVTGLYGYRTQHRNMWPGPAPRWRHVALLLLVALFFRLPAYHYVLGGQDEGLYVNIGHYIDHTGGIAAHDHVKQQLQDSPFLEQYVNDNQMFPGQYLAGVYARDPRNNKVEFQFYDEFQVWMALFDGVFGVTWGVYALTLLALLSVMYFYRLALLLTRSHHAALIAGGLLALNPLHAFFSKFPVSEVPTLCFSLIGFLMVAAWWTALPGQRQRGWLTLSVLAFLCVFTTRITGFMYLPFFIGMAIVSLFNDADALRSKGIQRWAVGVAVVYALSVLYGLVWVHSYSHDTYIQVFEPLLGHGWKRSLGVAILIGLSVWAAVAWMASRAKWRQRFSRWTSSPIAWLPPVIVLVTLLLAALKIHRLGWTPYYTADTGLGSQGWNLANGGWQSASASSLWTLIIFIGPLLVVAFLALISRRNADPRISFLRWFVAGFFVYGILLQWVTFYSPYYARYLLSELVPYLILLVVCAWSSLRPGGARAVLSLALFASLIYAGVLSAAQIGKSENDGAYAALSRLIAPVDPDDLILLKSVDEASINDNEIKVPLLYSFHRNVVSVGDAALSNQAYIAKLNSLYDDLYLLTSASQGPVGYTLIDSVRFKVMTFKHTHDFPRELVPVHDIVLYLYRLDHPQLPLDTTLSFAAGQSWMNWLADGWSGAESWGVWSEGKRSVLSIDPRELPPASTGLTLKLHVNAFVTPSHRVQQVVASVNGVQVGQFSVTYPKTDMIMPIPFSQNGLDPHKRIRIEFYLPDAISPQTLGLSGDARELAIGLVDATISATPSPGDKNNNRAPAK